MSQKIYSDLDVKGTATINSIPSATSDTDKFLVSDGGVVKYRTGAEMLSDLGVAPGVASNIQHQVKAGVAINKGQAVYVTGADGTNMIVGLASNATEATSSKTLGLMTSTVAINGFGNVVTEGLLAGLDTSTAIIGDPVWLGTNGNLIYGLVNKPYAPAHLVFIGIVTRVNLNNGEIFVKVQNGFELDEIHDIDLKTTVPVNGHVLGFNGTLWVNKTIAGWLGYTPADDANVVHKTGNEVIDGIKTFNAGSINIGDQIIVGIGTISKQNNIFVFTGSDGFLAGSMQNGNISVYNNNTYGSIQANLLTNNRNYTLPNASGTIALTSDVSALGALKQDKLTGPGFVKANAGVITYDNSTYLTSAVTTFSGGTTGLLPSTASSGTITLSGTLAIANGGTGATTAPLARTSLGATTVGSNIFTAANPNAITFLRANANNTVSFLDAAAFRTAIGVSTGGTITLSAIGVTPNLNGATITGSVLNLEPASIGFGGVVTTTIQTFAGEKTFVEDLKVNSLTIGKGGAIGNTAVNNTAIGIDALKVNTANNNTAIGKSALANNVGGYQNTAIGVNALLTNVGESSIANPTIPFVGIYNTAVGFEALKLNTGNNNTALGLSTLLNNTIGFQNTAIGSEALRSNVDGEENTAVGKDALRQNLDSNWNTAVGSSALQGNVGGFQNTAVGRYASYSNFGGAYNTSIGVDSLKANVNSNLNTGLGYKAGYTVTGARNTFLGSQDDNVISPQVATVINSIAIGNNAYTTKSNQAVLGNSLITETVLYGVIKLTDAPITSIGSYDIITRNTTSGNIESVSLTNINYWTKTGDNIRNNNIGNTEIKILTGKQFQLLNSANTVVGYIDESGIGRFGPASTYTAFGPASANVHLSMVRSQANADFTIGNPQISQAYSIRSSNYFGTNYWAGSAEVSASALAEHSFNIGNSIGNGITSGIFRISRTRVQSTVPVKYATDVSASYDDRTLVDKGYVTSIARPYKVYTALLTQTGTNAPTATVLENTIGPIVWSRSNPGLYLGTLTGAFTVSKSWGISEDVANGSNSSTRLRITGAPDAMQVLTALGTTTTDGLLANTPIEIRVYN
jgi:hypothetical protein